MARTILVPTDLQVGSLNALKAGLSGPMTYGTRIILVHAVQAPDGITNMLFYSPRKAMRAQMGSAFKEALAVLKNRFEHEIASIEILPFHGITQAAFDQFVEGHGVNEIHVSAAYTMRLNGRAIDPLPFLRKATVRVVEHGQSTPASIPMETNMDHLQLLVEG